MSSPTTYISDSQLLAQFSQMYRGVLDAFMDEIGTHRGQAMVLCTLTTQDAMTQSEIADRLSIQGATLTNMLQRLEEAKMVTRRRDANDNRLVRVYLTDAGRRQELAIVQKLKSLEDTVLSGVSEEEREVLRRLVWQMIRNMASES